MSRRLNQRDGARPHDMPVRRHPSNMFEGCDRAAECRPRDCERVSEFPTNVHFRRSGDAAEFTIHRRAPRLGDRPAHWPRSPGRVGPRASAPARDSGKERPGRVGQPADRPRDRGAFAHRLRATGQLLLAEVPVEERRARWVSATLVEQERSHEAWSAPFTRFESRSSAISAAEESRRCSCSASRNRRRNRSAWR